MANASVAGRLTSRCYKVLGKAEESVTQLVPQIHHLREIGLPGTAPGLLSAVQQSQASGMLVHRALGAGGQNHRFLFGAAHAQLQRRARTACRTALGNRITSCNSTANSGSSHWQVLYHNSLARPLHGASSATSGTSPHLPTTLAQLQHPQQPSPLSQPLNPAVPRNTTDDVLLDSSTPSSFPTSSRHPNANFAPTPAIRAPNPTSPSSSSFCSSTATPRPLSATPCPSPADSPDPSSPSGAAAAAAAAATSLTATPTRTTTYAPTRAYSQHIKSDSALLAALTAPPTTYAHGMGSVLDSIIKIYTVHSRPNYTLPWQNHPKRESTGTGFVVHDRLILTNAHVVADATYVLVKRHGSGTKYRADVQAVGHDCDLALLSVSDESFWTSPTAMQPLELGPVPELQQGVVVVGYPTGGDNTSVTSGVVSRVEVAQYAHAASHLMACQIDAAINPGNSGGPALQGDEVVGVAFQNLPGAENIGYIIPTPVVMHFLDEVRKYGSYQGYCSLGVLCQNLENPHLRSALGMSEGMTGVLVNTIQKTSNAAKVLQPGDVLLEFDGVKIANDGTVHLRQRERIYFSYLITLKPTGDTARVKVLREGVELSYDLTVTPNDLLVPVHCYDRLPSYYMFAGLVFVPLTQPYLHEYGEDWMNSAPRRLYEKAMHGMMQKPAQQIVILSQVLVDDVNTGYQQFQSLQVLRVDGEEVLNLAGLKMAVEHGAGRYVKFELEDERVMVVDRSLALTANTRIMDRYRVPSSVSADIE